MFLLVTPFPAIAAAESLVSDHHVAPRVFYGSLLVESVVIYSFFLFGHRLLLGMAG
jgi:hypothetical protein